MKLTTFLAPGGAAHIGALLPGETTISDFTAADAAPYFRSMLDLIDAGPAALEHARRLVERPTATHPVPAVARLAPLPQPRRLRDCLCFETHFRQSRANRHLFGIGTQRLDPASVELPRVWYERPIYYKGNPFSVVGDGADVHWPAYSQVIDYELEIGMVTSRGGKNIPVAEASSHIFGYTIFNDFSARDAQYTEMQGGLGPAKGKDFDTGNAMGPWLVTADEIADPQALDLWLEVDGHRYQDGNTRTMVFGIPFLVSYLSRFMSLQPGDVISTGTPPGVGLGQKPPVYLRAGQVMRLGIAGLGEQRQQVVQA